MIDANTAIFIDFCSKCGTHAWCTKHNEARYLAFFNLFKEVIEKEFGDLVVYGNTHPVANKEIPAPLGGFEIIFRKCRIFSKLRSGQWPMVKPVLTAIKDVLEGNFPPDCDFIDYHKIPLDGKKRVFYMPTPAPLPKTEVQRTGRRIPGSNQDTSSQYLSNRHPETTKSRVSLPSATGTPRKPIFSFTNVDKTRPHTTNQLPGIYYNQANQAQSATIGTLPTVKASQYYLGRENSLRRGSAPDIEIPNSLPDMQGPSILIPGTHNTYLQTTDNRNGNTNGHVHLGTLTTSARINMTVDSNGLSLNDDMMGRMKTPMEQYFENPDEIPSANQVVQQRYYSKYVVIKQTKDKEINEATVFTLQKELEDATPSKRGPKKLQWFPDCQRTNTSPDRIGLRDAFEEKLQPYVRQDSKKVSGGDGSPIHNKHFNKTPDKKKSFKVPTNSKNTASPAKTVANLKKLVYNEEKISQIKIARGKLTKKKITIVPDLEKNVKIEVFGSLPHLVAMDTHDMNVPKGNPMKISLRFEGREEEVINDIFVFILKDGKPWQKINISLAFL